MDKLERENKALRKELEKRDNEDFCRKYGHRWKRVNYIGPLGNPIYCERCGKKEWD